MKSDRPLYLFQWSTRFTFPLTWRIYKHTNIFKHKSNNKRTATTAHFIKFGHYQLNRLNPNPSLLAKDLILEKQNALNIREIIPIGHQIGSYKQPIASSAKDQSILRPKHPNHQWSKYWAHHKWQIQYPQWNGPQISFLKHKRKPLRLTLTST